MSPLDKEQFELAAQNIREENFTAALVLLETLLSRHPRSAALHWHRSHCLQKLEREAEAIDALDQVIALKPDYLPALIARVRHAHDDGNADEFEPLVRQALSLQPEHPQALTLLAGIRQANDAPHTEILDLLNRSLAVDPKQADALLMRGELHASQALEPSDDDDVIHDALGMSYQRRPLERALEDFESAATLSNDMLPIMRLVDTAQKLGERDKALSYCDIALGKLEEGNVHGRRHIEQLRARVEGGDQAVRDQMAAMFESGFSGLSGDRTIDDDVAHSAMSSAADMLRKGKNLDIALDSFISDSPDDLVATNIARQIFNFAHEVTPGLQEVDAKDYPAYQKKHAETCKRALAPLNYSVITDAEAMNLGAQMGMRVLVRVFFNPDIGNAASFALKPKWPGTIGFLMMLLSGKWRTERVLECKTRLRSGTFLVTRAMSPEPWDYSSMDLMQFETLPPGTSPAKIASRHQQRVLAALAADPGEAIEPAHTLDEIEGQWIETNQVKMEHRREIGYVTESELRTILGKQYERFADKVRTRLALMTEE